MLAERRRRRAAEQEQRRVFAADGHGDVAAGSPYVGRPVHVDASATLFGPVPPIAWSNPRGYSAPVISLTRSAKQKSGSPLHRLSATSRRISSPDLSCSRATLLTRNASTSSNSRGKLADAIVLCSLSSCLASIFLASTPENNLSKHGPGSFSGLKMPLYRAAYSTSATAFFMCLEKNCTACTALSTEPMSRRKRIRPLELQLFGLVVVKPCPAVASSVRLHALKSSEGPKNPSFAVDFVIEANRLKNLTRHRARQPRHVSHW